MLVSISVFMIFVAVSAHSYTSLFNANRVANESQKVYRDIRAVFDTLAADIRRGKIDFTCFDRERIDVQCQQNLHNEFTSVIALIVEENNQIKRLLYKFSEGRLVKRTEVYTDEFTRWSVISDWQPLARGKRIFDAISFNVFPHVDPYAREQAGVTETQWQPTVTLTMAIKGAVFKTTYVSRSYGR